MRRAILTLLMLTAAPALAEEVRLVPPDQEASIADGRSAGPKTRWNNGAHLVSADVSYLSKGPSRRWSNAGGLVTADIDVDPGDGLTGGPPRRWANGTTP
jgi:hypothetical protein